MKIACVFKLRVPTSSESAPLDGVYTLRDQNGLNGDGKGWTLGGCERLQLTLSYA